MSLKAEGRYQQLGAELNPGVVSSQREVEPSVSLDCVHHLFEAQVARSPDAVAVRYAGKTLTYRQLNQRSNQLAHHLQSLGVGSEVLVGVYLERSPEMIVALLGILKAGGAYVPLSPSDPSDRVAFILQETQAAIVLSQASLAQDLPTDLANMVCLDADWETIARYPQQNPTSAVTPANLIYVLYTSGSTGKPKGVMIPHVGICNQIFWRQATFPLTPDDRVLQNIAFTFDPSVWQIFWTLSTGAQLILPRPGGHQDSAYLVHLMAQEAVTVVALVPALLRVLLRENGLERCRHLRHVFCGGELLPGDLLKQFFSQFGVSVQLHNVYGPTEASIDATCWTCQPGHDRPSAPIGKPIANTCVYVLDEQLQPVSVGEPGELHISGVGLARGYLNRPELTTEKFVANPFAASEGSAAAISPFSRLYRTGDRVCQQPDGNLEFLGRIDHQVKIRGFRIEPGEIEATLSRHPSVQECVVVARQERSAEKRLVAYVVLLREPPLSMAELRRFLKERLPEYMVPAVFVRLESLPLNRNGKVDRTALPAPDIERCLTTPFVAPKTTEEQALTQIWQEVLQIPTIGTEDNFFDLGGNSLLAMQVAIKIEATFQKRLGLNTFFQAATIAQQARALQEEQQETGEGAIVEIQPLGSQPPFFCVHPRNGSVFQYYRLAQLLGNDRPFYGVQSLGVHEGALPHRSIEEMAAAYLEEIRLRQPQGPYLLGGYSFGGVVAFEMAQQLLAQGQSVARLVLIDTYNTQHIWFAPPSFRDRLSGYLQQLHQRSWWQKLPYAQAVIQQELLQKFRGLQPQWGDQAQLSPSSQHLEAVRAVCETAARQYRPQPYPGETILLRATEQPEDSRFQPVRLDPTLGWEGLIAALKIQDVPGTHFSLLDEPHVHTLAETLRACLQSA